MIILNATILYIFCALPAAVFFYWLLVKVLIIFVKYRAAKKMLERGY